MVTAFPSLYECTAEFVSCKLLVSFEKTEMGYKYGVGTSTLLRRMRQNVKSVSSINHSPDQEDRAATQAFIR